MKPIIIILSGIVTIATFSCSPSSGLTKSAERQTKIDSTFSHYEQLGFNTQQRLKYIYHFSDRERVPLQELEKGLERDEIEVISITNTLGRRPWHLYAFENTIHGRNSMAEREKSFRLKMYSYKVDHYHGFRIEKADIEYLSIAPENFMVFIKELDNESLFNVGTRLDLVKDHDKAIVIFDELIKREYKLDTSYFKMGTALVGTHEYVEGIEHWEKAIELNPDYLEAHMQAGIIFFENSHWKKAHQHFNEADRIRPNDDVILYHLAKSLIKLERYNEAYNTIRPAVKLNPRNAYAKGVLRSLKTAAVRKLRKKYPDK